MFVLLLGRDPPAGEFTLSGQTQARRDAEDILPGRVTKKLLYYEEHVFERSTLSIGAISDAVLGCGHQVVERKDREARTGLESVELSYHHLYSDNCFHT